MSSKKGKASAPTGGAPTTSGFIGFSAFANFQPGGAIPEAAAAVASPAPAEGKKKGNKENGPRTAEKGSGNGGSGSGGGGGGGLGEIFYTGEDAEIRAVLRNVAKKDVTTKLKALQELKDLLPTREKAVLRGFLGAWSYTFISLAMSNDRRVRASACGVNDSLVSLGIRKSFAPYLSELLPVWWLLTADPAKEAALSAKTSFLRMFPSPDKQAEALSTYASDVVQRLSKWLAQSSEELSDMRISSPEEASERYERIQATVPAALASLIAFVGQPVVANADAANAAGAVAIVSVFPDLALPSPGPTAASAAGGAGSATAAGAGAGAGAADEIAAPTVTSAKEFAAKLQPAWDALAPVFGADSALFKRLAVPAGSSAKGGAWTAASASSSSSSSSSSTSGPGTIASAPFLRRALYVLLRTVVDSAPHLLANSIDVFTSGKSGAEVAAAVALPVAGSGAEADQEDPEMAVIVTSSSAPLSRAASSTAHAAATASAAAATGPTVLLPRKEVIALIFGTILFNEQHSLCVQEALSLAVALLKRFPAMWSSIVASLVSSFSTSTTAALPSPLAAPSSAFSPALTDSEFVGRLRASAAEASVLPSSFSVPVPALETSAAGPAASLPDATLFFQPLLRLLRNAFYGAHSQASFSLLVEAIAALPRTILLAPLQLLLSSSSSSLISSAGASGAAAGSGGGKKKGGAGTAAGGGGGGGAGASGEDTTLSGGSSAGGAVASKPSCLGLVLAEALWSALKLRPLASSEQTSANANSDFSLSSSSYSSLLSTYSDCCLFVLASSTKAMATNPSSSSTFFVQGIKAAACLVSTALLPLCGGGSAYVIIPATLKSTSTTAAAPAAAAAAETAPTAATAPLRASSSNPSLANVDEPSASSAAEPSPSSSSSAALSSALRVHHDGGSPASSSALHSLSFSLQNHLAHSALDSLPNAAHLQLASMIRDTRETALAHHVRGKALEEACRNAAVDALKRAASVLSRRLAAHGSTGNNEAADFPECSALLALLQAMATLLVETCTSAIHTAATCCDSLAAAAPPERAAPSSSVTLETEAAGEEDVSSDAPSAASFAGLAGGLSPPATPGALRRSTLKPSASAASASGMDSSSVRFLLRQPDPSAARRLLGSTLQTLQGWNDLELSLFRDFPAALASKVVFTSLCNTLLALLPGLAARVTGHPSGGAAAPLGGTEAAETAATLESVANAGVVQLAFALNEVFSVRSCRSSSLALSEASGAKLEQAVSGLSRLFATTLSSASAPFSALLAGCLSNGAFSSFAALKTTNEPLSLVALLLEAATASLFKVFAAAQAASQPQQGGGLDGVSRVLQAAFSAPVLHKLWAPAATASNAGGQGDSEAAAFLTWALPDQIETESDAALAAEVLQTFEGVAPALVALLQGVKGAAGDAATALPAAMLGQTGLTLLRCCAAASLRSAASHLEPLLALPSSLAGAASPSQALFSVSVFQSLLSWKGLLSPSWTLGLLRVVSDMARQLADAGTTAASAVDVLSLRLVGLSRVASIALTAQAHELKAGGAASEVEPVVADLVLCGVKLGSGSLELEKAGEALASLANDCTRRGLLSQKGAASLRQQVLRFLQDGVLGSLAGALSSSQPSEASSSAGASALSMLSSVLVQFGKLEGLADQGPGGEQGSAESGASRALRLLGMDEEKKWVDSTSSLFAGASEPTFAVLIAASFATLSSSSASSVAAAVPSSTIRHCLLVGLVAMLVSVASVGSSSAQDYAHHALSSLLTAVSGSGSAIDASEVAAKAIFQGRLANYNRGSVPSGPVATLCRLFDLLIADSAACTPPAKLRTLASTCDRLISFASALAQSLKGQKVRNEGSSEESALLLSASSICRLLTSMPEEQEEGGAAAAFTAKLEAALSQGGSGLAALFSSGLSKEDLRSFPNALSSLAVETSAAVASLVALCDSMEKTTAAIARRVGSSVSLSSSDLCFLHSSPSALAGIKAVASALSSRAGEDTAVLVQLNFIWSSARRLCSTLILCGALLPHRCLGLKSSATPAATAEAEILILVSQRLLSFATLLSSSLEVAAADSIRGQLVRAFNASGARAKTRTQQAELRAAAEEEARQEAARAVDEDEDGVDVDAEAGSGGAFAVASGAALEALDKSEKQKSKDVEEAWLALPLHYLPSPLNGLSEAAPVASVLQFLVLRLAGPGASACPVLTSASALSLLSATVNALSSALAHYKETDATRGDLTSTGEAAAEADEGEAAAVAWDQESKRTLSHQLARFVAWVCPAVLQVLGATSKAFAAASASASASNAASISASPLLSFQSTLLHFSHSGLGSARAVMKDVFTLYAKAAELLDEAVAAASTAAPAHNHCILDSRAMASSLSSFLSVASAYSSSGGWLEASLAEQKKVVGSIAEGRSASSSSNSGARAGAGAAARSSGFAVASHSDSGEDDNTSGGGLLSAASSLLQVGSSFLSSWLSKPSAAAPAPVPAPAPANDADSEAASAPSPASGPEDAAVEGLAPPTTDLGCSALPEGLYLLPSCLFFHLLGPGAIEALLDSADDGLTAAALDSFSLLYSASNELRSCFKEALPASTPPTITAAFPFVALPVLGSSSQSSNTANAGAGAAASTPSSSVPPALSFLLDKNGPFAGVDPALVADILREDDSEAGMAFRGRNALPQPITTVLECEENQLCLVLAAQEAADRLASDGEDESDDEQNDEEEGQGEEEEEHEEEEIDEKTATAEQLHGSGTPAALLDAQPSASRASAAKAQQALRAISHLRTLLAALDFVTLSSLPSRAEDIATYLLAGDVNLGASVTQWANHEEDEEEEEDAPEQEHHDEDELDEDEDYDEDYEIERALAASRKEQQKMERKAKAEAEVTSATRAKRALAAAVKLAQEKKEQEASSAKGKKKAAKAGAGSSAGSSEGVLQGARLIMAVQACLHLALETPGLLLDPASSSSGGRNNNSKSSKTKHHGLQKELGVLSHVFVRRVAEALPDRFASFVRSLPRGVQTAIATYVSRFVAPKLFAAQAIQVQALIAMMKDAHGDSGDTADAHAHTPVSPSSLLALLQGQEQSEALRKLSRVGSAVSTAASSSSFSHEAATYKPGSFDQEAAFKIEETKRKIQRAFTKDELKTLTTGDFTIRCPSAAAALAAASFAKASGGSSEPTTTASADAGASSVDRTIVATFKHEEATVVVKLVSPPHFPITKASVACESRHGVTEEKWLVWQRQMITLMGGSSSGGGFGTLNALFFLKGELDGLFAGVEPCPICYSIIGGTARALPNVRCGTCRNAFHRSPCLSNWFASSHQASCPMCRSLFK